MATHDAQDAMRILVGYIAQACAGNHREAGELLGSIADDDVAMWRSLAKASLGQGAGWFYNLCRCRGQDPAEAAKDAAVSLQHFFDDNPDL